MSLFTQLETYLPIHLAFPTDLLVQQNSGRQTLDQQDVGSGCHRKWASSKKPGSIHPRRVASLDDVPYRLVDSQSAVVFFHTVVVLSSEDSESIQQPSNPAGQLLLGEVTISISTGWTCPLICLHRSEPSPRRAEGGPSSLPIPQTAYSKARMTKDWAPGSWSRPTKPLPLLVSILYIDLRGTSDTTSTVVRQQPASVSYSLAVKPPHATSCLHALVAAGPSIIASPHRSNPQAISLLIRLTSLSAAPVHPPPSSATLPDGGPAASLPVQAGSLANIHVAPVRPII